MVLRACKMGVSLLRLSTTGTIRSVLCGARVMCEGAEGVKAGRLMPAIQATITISPVNSSKRRVACLIDALVPMSGAFHLTVDDIIKPACDGHTACAEKEPREFASATECFGVYEIAEQPVQHFWAFRSQVACDDSACENVYSEPLPVSPVVEGSQ
ncbi:hypothetical protein EVC30_017 [Rhizobium phage RHph_Y1_11]|nr:hypothetical protein EVC30_017 [Rhizobium phage RHph_Y1_11]